MSIPALSPLNLEDINFSKPGGPVRFDNPSDTIFASLFLPFSSESDEDCLGSVPWQFCDRILAAIRSPQFDSKEVSFKNWVDMFSSVGNRRRDKWSTLENITDCHWTKRNTLQTMVLVHSSWHARAKRALGYSLVSYFDPIQTTLQNPIFGVWTKELHLSFDQYDDDKFDRWSLTPSLSHVYLTKIFCARVPNIRLASIRLKEASTNFLTTICEVLTHLDSLEELHLEPGQECNQFPVDSLIAAILGVRYPTLRVLEFHDPDIDIDYLTSQIDSLAPLQKLHSVRLVWRVFNICPKIQLSRASWSRDVAQRGSHFSIKDITIDFILDLASTDMHTVHVQEFNTALIRLLQSTELVRFQFFRPPSVLYLNANASSQTAGSISSLVGPWLALCSSAHTVLFIDFAWKRLKMFGQIYEEIGALSGIEELVIEAESPNYLHGPSEDDVILAKTQFPLNDEELSRVIGAMLFPGLRVLKVTFQKRWLEISVEGYKLGDMDEHEERRMLLPHCRQKCIERSVTFSVDIV
ncbi:hypothetical protein SCHPADRAFT_886690 [Schizopora paradoxa]|uniref:Uncharacterized protein n=1 Tax=Schizopora paradoxa TaxID=27342 RepID=A0A0H2SLA5_9AGAM|nr:hypothetical protein SCHPADRAFT_886690 [Schizopora paradoxa]